MNNSLQLLDAMENCGAWLAVQGVVIFTTRTIAVPVTVKILVKRFVS